MREKLQMRVRRNPKHKTIVQTVMSSAHRDAPNFVTPQKQHGDELASNASPHKLEFYKWNNAEHKPLRNLGVSGLRHVAVYESRE